MQNLEEFIDKLIKEKGFDTKDPEVVAQIKEDLMKSVEEKINAMIMQNMPEDKLAEFSDVLDTEDQEKIMTFVKSQIPDIDQRTAGVLVSFANTYAS